MQERRFRIRRPDDIVEVEEGAPPTGHPGWQQTVREACGTVRDALRSAERAVRRLRKRRATVPLPEEYGRGLERSAPRCLATRVLIVAEASIPQCLKYRVLQRQEAFRRIGVECNWRPWGDRAACRAALQTHSHAIFYRVPAEESVLALVAEARRLRVPTWWEADDLIFDEAAIRSSQGLTRLGRRTIESLVHGADLYRRAMLACDAAIASTPRLAEAMERAGMDDVRVIANGLDEQTLAAAEAARVAADEGRAADESREADEGLVRIVYGSGTNAHDVDFEEAAPALARVLDRCSHARLRLVGSVAVPACLERHGDRIERLPAGGFEDYLHVLAGGDIAIAPLEDAAFSDAKSAIKYLEASILGLPSVCSPRAAFASMIVDGVNGLLSDDDESWEKALASLVTEPARRRRIAAAARATVLRDAAPARIAHRQVAPLVADGRDRNRLQVLSVNVFYGPRTFGGATIVAESVNRLMHDEHGIDVHVFTTVPTAVAPPHTLHRYEFDGIGVFGMGLPDGAHDGPTGFDNPAAVACFDEVLDAVAPDVVHFHCIQGIGIGAVEACRDRGTPYAVTLHDAWWLCGRQFMIDRHGHFCHQQRIDANVCAACVDNARTLPGRTRRAHEALAGADLLMAPSRFFADFHAANGFPGVLVNKNGVTPPLTSGRVRRDGRVRVGYVGGNTPIKGFHLVRKVFAELGHLPATLVLADNTLNLGFSSFGADAIGGIPHVEVVPAYTHRTIDDFFGDIDVLLFPTQWKESFGLTVREAIARNVWVIATDAGGVVEDILPGRNGTVIPFADDGTALRAAIIDAVGMIDRVAPGSPVAFAADGIRFWDAQAAELAGMLRGCTRVAIRRAA
jgi:glycosyltransferase involved in cell wall biosynthesis